MMFRCTPRQSFCAVIGHAAGVIWSTIRAPKQARPMRPAAVTARRSRVVAWVFAIMTASVVLFPSSARADALDCLASVANATLNVENLKKFLEFQTEYGQCNTYLANPTPTFATTVALVAGAMATGILPPDAKGCIDAIPHAGAKLALALIDAFGFEVDGELKKKLNDTVESVAQDAYKQVLQDVPPLAAIVEMFNCACAVAAYGKDLVDQFLEAADSCGGVIGDIGNAVLEIGGGFGDIPGNLSCFFSCPGAPPPSVCYLSNACAMGQQCNPYKYDHGKKIIKMESSSFGGYDHSQDCVPCSQVPHGVGLAPEGPLGKSTCGCSGGFFANYETIDYGKTKTLMSCDCPAPFSAHYERGKGEVCGCPLGKSLIGGKCDLTCQPNQQATAKKEPVETPGIFGSTHVIEKWSCESCGPNKTSDGHGPCRQLCAPNERLVAKADTPGGIAGEIAELAEQLTGIKVEKVTESCEPCADGTKSDGKGPCIPCEGDKSYVAGGACHSCKPWQQVHSAKFNEGGSRCEDICPVGSVLYDPNAPASVSLQSPGAPSVTTGPIIPGQGASGQLG